MTDSKPSEVLDDLANTVLTIVDGAKDGVGLLSCFIKASEDMESHAKHGCMQGAVGAYLSASMIEALEEFFGQEQNFRAYKILLRKIISDRHERLEGGIGILDALVEAAHAKSKKE